MIDKKEHNKLYAREYRKRNKDRVAANEKRYKEKNKERLKIYVKEYRKKNPNYDRNWKLRKYRAPYSSFEEALTAQGNTCAAIWHIDHDHKTNLYRGILCHCCNLALGSAKDDIARLRGLIEYLEAHREK